MAGAPRVAGSMTAPTPLSAQDASFLHFEGPATPMHVGVVAILDAGPLATATSGVDAERIASHLEARLHRLPRYRQRLRLPPLPGRPVWVDDDRFALRHHVHHLALPRPGGEAELAALAGCVFSQPLPRDRPLWEMWVAEGLAGGRFALLMKVHHCMVDGVSGVGLLQLLLDASPEVPREEPEPWRPAPPPHVLSLLAREGALRWERAARSLAALPGAVAHPERLWQQAEASARAVGDALAATLRPTPPMPVHGAVGAHRAIGWRSLDLAQVKEARKRLGGTVNDVVLAVVSGALRRLPSGVGGRTPRDWRVVVPVNLRSADEGLEAANRVSALFVTLPVSEADPRRRFARVCAETQRVKSSRMAAGIELLTQLAEWTASPLLVRLGSRFATLLEPYHLIVSNVPGPQFPLYLCGARLRALIPQLPLFDRQGLALAAMSYDGAVHFGIVADPSRLPRPEEVGDALTESFDELRAAAGMPRAA